jgi:hypothetical protein
VAGILFPGDNVDEEVKHVALGERSCNVTSLQRPPLVVLGVDPRAHRQFRYEYVATFREENGRLSGDHFHLGVGLHDLLDTRQRELMDLEIMGVGLKVVDGLLPVGG